MSAITHLVEAASHLDPESIEDLITELRAMQPPGRIYNPKSFQSIQALIRVVYDGGITLDQANALEQAIRAGLEREIGNSLLTCGDPEQTVESWNITTEIY